MDSIASATWKRFTGSDCRHCQDCRFEMNLTRVRTFSSFLKNGSQISDVWRFRKLSQSGSLAQLTNCDF